MRRRKREEDLDRARIAELQRVAEEKRQQELAEQQRAIERARAAMEAAEQQRQLEAEAVERMKQEQREAEQSRCHAAAHATAAAILQLSNQRQATFHATREQARRRTAETRLFFSKIRRPRHP